MLFLQTKEYELTLGRIQTECHNELLHITGDFGLT